MLAAAPSVTPIAVALILSLLAFGACLPWIVSDSRRPLPPPRPVKVKPVAAARRVEQPPDIADTGQVPVPARRGAIVLGVLGALALWATFGAGTRRSARR